MSRTRNSASSRAISKGRSALPDYGLTADLCCNFRQLGPTVELVRQCPNTQFILDHIAKPNIRGGEMEPWASQMRDLASLPNVMCKISGVATEANHDSWTIDEIRPYVMHVLEVFGEDRVVFGSDWPVCTLATPYRRWVQTLDELTAGLDRRGKGQALARKRDPLLSPRCLTSTVTERDH